MSRSPRRPVAGWLASVVLVGASVAGVATAGVLREETPVEVAEPAPMPEVAVQADAAQAIPPEGDQPVTPEYSPWPPGSVVHLTTDYPQPDVPFNATECTIAMSFTGADGRMYAVTASHCGSVDDLIWPSDGTTIDDFTHELGRVIYSGLEDDSIVAEHRPDVAIIEVFNPDRPVVLAGNPPRTTVLGELPADAEAELCKIGGTTGITCGPSGERDQNYLMIDPDTGAEIRTLGDTAELCARRGDSGGPILADLDGRQVVVGLVSGTSTDAHANAADACGGVVSSDGGDSVAYASASQIHDVIRGVVPDALLDPA